MNYRRLTEIDEEVKNLERLRECVIDGEYSSSTIIPTSHYVYLTLKVEHKLSDISWNDKVEYEVLASVIVGQINYKLNKLQAEKKSLLVPWYKRLFSPL